MSQASTAPDPGAQSRALWLSTIAFTVCFAVWTIFSIIGVQLKRDLGLNETQFGLLVGTPILTGSLIRLMLGIWADQYGGRVVYTGTMVAAAVATFLLVFAYDYPTFLLAALGVGIAGGSFAVGIAYVSKWFPKEKQGTALGIFGAGNVGAAVTKFLAPVSMVAFGWKTVAIVWAVALLVTAVVFWFMTQDDPDLAHRRATGQKPEPMSALLVPLKDVQVWRFSLYYFFVFGAFVALALWLPRYIIDTYGFSITTAGMIGAAYSVRRVQAEKESAAIIGFTSAVAAYGAFFIPKSYGTAIAMTGSPVAALWGFFAFYLICIAVTWGVYTRRGGVLHDIERRRASAPAATA